MIGTSSSLLKSASLFSPFTHAATRLFAMTLVFVAFLTLGFAAAEAQTEARSRAIAREGVADETPAIFDVRKSLPMEPNEPSYHDFYINAGTEAGFKKGQYLPVQRAIPVHDPVQNKQQAILTIPVGKIVVIHSERNITVARLVTELGDDERPTLEYEAIMIGDRIDMKGITTEAPKDIKKKKKTASAVDASASVAVTVQTVSDSTAVSAAAPVLTSAPVTSAAAQGVSQGASQSATQSSSGTPTANGAPAVVENAAKAPAPVAPVKSDVGQQPSAPPRVTQTVPPPTA